jgi:hypothetical protein
MPPKWKGSYAQDLLYRDLRDGTIGPHMTAAQAQATRPEFLEYEDPDKFEEYFNKMRQKAIVAKDLSKKDYQGLMNDRVNHHPIEPFSEARGYPRWEGSDAERMLKEHVASCSYKDFASPNEYWQSQEEFQVFPLKVFRKHIEQEERLVKFYRYRDEKACKKREKKKKKHEKACK